MIEFMINNAGTIAVSAMLSAAVVLACVKIFTDKRSGKSSCGGKCGDCPFSSGCGKGKNK